MPTRPALLIALPHGLGTSGVSTWATRLARMLADRGAAVGLLVHDEPATHAQVEVDLPPSVRYFDASGLPPLRGDPDAGGEAIRRALPRYRDAVERMAHETSGPVVVSPNLDGDCYGVIAKLCGEMPDAIRVIGWQHNDIEHDYRMLEFYAPIITRFVGVSRWITRELARRMPARDHDVVELPYGVELGREPDPRGLPERRRVRLLYTGRMDHDQKRVMALAALSAELDRRGIDHELILRGDGPAAAEFDRVVADRPHVRRLATAPWSTIERELERADLFVLASRYEGLCVAMLEAMARGCVPVVTRVASGSGQVIESGWNGEMVDAGDHADDQAIARVMADGVERVLTGDPAELSAHARATIRARFGLERHVDAVVSLLAAAAETAPRRWPADRPCGFTEPGPDGSGPIPAGAEVRMRAVLDRLAGRRVVLHGAGRHTSALEPIVAVSRARVVAVTDDDRQKHGGTIAAWPIVAPEEAGETGATDVVISSWMHEGSIWNRRGVYERQGLAVHAIYRDEPSPDDEGT